MPLTGWGDPARRRQLPAHAVSWLHKEIGRGVLHPVVAPSRLPSSRLEPGALAALQAAVGAAHVSLDDTDRALHAGGKSYLDLLERRAGDVGQAPDAVVLPGSTEDVVAVLSVCSTADVAVVPFGGGTSVVGGVKPSRGGHHAVISLDLRRLDALLSLDPVSRTATFQPGVLGPQAEELLAARGLTLGHLPQSWEHASIGGFVATRSAGQASSGYGRIEDMVVALTVVTPAGIMRLGRGAPSAAGPDLLAMMVGSEGVFGVVTEVTLRVRVLPAVRRYEGYLVRSWEAGQDLLRKLAQEGHLPTIGRLSDADETRVQLALTGAGVTGALARGYVRLRGGPAGCLLVLGWEGTAPEVAACRATARAALAGAVRLGSGVGKQWERGRFRGPYLRDELLAHGVLVETMETSASWRALPAVYGAIRTALAGALSGTPPLIMTHISHVYPQGACLYVTVLARAADDPAAQCVRAKVAATDAIMASGATLTHHHSVGADHRPWLAQEIGELGVEVLRAVKTAFDPNGILNPGTLLPDDGE